MSRIGKKPIPLASGAKAEVKGKTITVTGSKGTLSWTHPEGVTVSVDAGSNMIQVDRTSDASQHRAMHGTARALIQNMVVGVTEGYVRNLELYGTGYSCSSSGNTVELNCGYSHPVKLTIPAGIKVEIQVPAARGDETPAKLSVSGIDKQVVGSFARTIKDVRHPEPYKGKGIRYAGEQIRRKAGKAFAGAGG